MHSLTACSLPNQEYLASRLDYDPQTGLLTWRARKVTSNYHNSWNSRLAGNVAFTSRSKNGYLHGSLDGNVVYAHRIIWKMVYGEDPNLIDHINGDKTDNRIENLRSVSVSENQKNAKRQSRNTSGVTGVSFDNSRSVWLATINSQGKTIRLGRFTIFDDAVKARKDAEQRLGFSKSHGRCFNQATTAE